MAFGDLRQAVVHDTDNTSPNDVAFGSNVAVGSLLVACYSTADGVDSSITDTRGNTWATAVTHDLPAFAAALHIAYAYSASAGANTVTFTTSSAANAQIWIAEFEGPFSPAPLDDVNDAEDLTGTSSTPSTSVTTSRANSLVIGFTLFGGTTATPGSGFTERGEATNWEWESKVQGAAGAVTVDMSLDSGANAWAITAAAFRSKLVLTAAAGSYVVSGTAVALTAARKLAAASGAYTLTGTVADLIYSGAVVVASYWPYHRKRRR